MSYFGRTPVHKKIAIDAQATNAASPDVAKRLTRIEGNYRRLDEILTELESRFEFEDRLIGNFAVGETNLPNKPR